MSWNIEAMGKPEAVAAKLAKQFAVNKCSEPEESIRQSVAGIVAAALATFSKGTAVSVRASGSQSSDMVGTAQATHVHSLNVEIKPLYGFVE